MSVRKADRGPLNSRRRLWLAAGAASLAAHLAVLTAALLVRPSAPLTPAEAVETVEVTLVRPWPPAPPPPELRAGAPAGGGAEAPPAPGPPTPPRPAPRAARVIAPPPPAVAPLSAAVAAPAPAFATLSDARLAGAATADSGSGDGSREGTGPGPGPGGGPGCDMVGRLQAALAADPEVRAAVAEAHRADGRGRALLIWDGDWIQTPGQAGKGLAGVRQAIALEVAFAPEACRRQPMRGLVLIRFPDGPRVAFGAPRWRWSELLGR